MPHALQLPPLLEDAQTIAIVGCSGRTSRTSHGIAVYLQQHGYRVIPVNPHYDEILDERCYPDLPSVPDDVRIDIVNIFRAPAYTAEMVRSALARVKQTGERPVIWTQIGVSSDEAKHLAEAAGLPYIENKCIMVEHQRHTQ